MAAKLRPGNVHSADDWEELLLPGNRAPTEALHGGRVPRRRCLCQAGDLRGTGGAQREVRDPHSVQRKSGAEHRRTVDATRRQTEPQASGLVQEFPVPGGELGDGAASRGEGGVSI